MFISVPITVQLAKHPVNHGPFVNRLPLVGSYAFVVFMDRGVAVLDLQPANPCRHRNTSQDTKKRSPRHLRYRSGESEKRVTGDDACVRRG